MQGRFCVPHEKAGGAGLVSSSGEFYLTTAEEYEEFKAVDNKTQETIDEFVRSKLAEAKSS